MTEPTASETRLVGPYRVTVFDSACLVEATITVAESGRELFRAGFGDIDQAWEQTLADARRMAASAA